MLSFPIAKVVRDFAKEQVSLEQETQGATIHFELRQTSGAVIREEVFALTGENWAADEAERLFFRLMNREEK